MGNGEEMSYLVHHGIKGQKWGVRRFQNPDGSYTEAGKKRRYKNLEKAYNRARDETYNKTFGKNRGFFSIKKSQQAYEKAVSEGQAAGQKAFKQELRNDAEYQKDVAKLKDSLGTYQGEVKKRAEDSIAAEEKLEKMALPIAKDYYEQFYEEAYGRKPSSKDADIDDGDLWYDAHRYAMDEVEMDHPDLVSARDMADINYLYDNYAKQYKAAVDSIIIGNSDYRVKNLVEQTLDEDLGIRKK